MVGHYLYISKGVYILLKMESRGFWVVLLVLEGTVRILNPWGVDIKEGVAASKIVLKRAGKNGNYNTAAIISGRSLDILFRK